MQRKKVEWNQQTYRRFVELWSAKTFFDISEQITPTLKISLPCDYCLHKGRTSLELAFGTVRAMVGGTG